MSFTTINSTEIESGKPVAATTQTKIKDNFDDHESRIESLESSVVTTIPIIMNVNGYYCVATDLMRTTANSSITISGVRLLIKTAGSAGTTQIDLQRKRGVGAFATIFTTKPSVAFGAGDNALSSNGVLDSSMVDIQAGDILRLDISSIQTDGNGFDVRIDYTR